MSDWLSLTDVPVALLAGGLATRLGEMSHTTPKALVDIDGRPFIDHQLSLLHRHGIRKVVLCLGHLGGQIEAHLGDGASRGMEIQYSYDGPTLAGTGGAVRRALPMLGDVFWVMYGDSYMDIDYPAIADHFMGATPRPLGLMTVIRNDNRWDRSNAIFENGRLTCYDKRNRAEDMRYIDYGVQLLRREALACVSADERCDLADLYRGMVAHGAMVGYEVFNRFYEIGTPSSLEETRQYLSLHAGSSAMPARISVAQKDPGRRWARPGVEGAVANINSGISSVCCDNRDPLFQPQELRMSFTSTYLQETAEVLAQLDQSAINRVVGKLAQVRNQNGRIFFLGIGGSAANASHAVNDFRKICGFEAYAPTDNVSEFSARANDDGWESVFANWLKGSRLNARDMVFVLSVGGGNLEKNVSPNLVRAVQYAKEVHATVVGIVGRDGGFTAQAADACVIVPTVNPTNVTPHSEAFQAIIWHLIVSHPALKVSLTKWEAAA